MRRVGLLGGAFNPPHMGHLKLAALALEHLGLDELRFVPTARSPHKPTPEGPGEDQRLALLREAISGFPGPVKVEPLELERGGTSYTADTVEALAAREPDAAWILILGSDQWPGLPRWHRARDLFRKAAVAISPRPGFPEPDAMETVPPDLGLRPVAAWSGRPGELLWLPGTEVPFASSELRAFFQANPAGSRDHQGIPTQVLAAIERENLYR